MHGAGLWTAQWQIAPRHPRCVLLCRCWPQHVHTLACTLYWLVGQVAGLSTLHELLLAQAGLPRLSGLQHHNSMTHAPRQACRGLQICMMEPSLMLTWL